MSKQYLRALLVAALGWYAGAACAQRASGDALTAEAGIAQVRAQKQQAYESVLARFDKALEATPDDASIAVARCEYLDGFTDDESGDWIESASDDLEECTTSLKQRWPSAPEVQLFQLERTWETGEIDIASLSKRIDGWPAPLRKRALSHLAALYEREDKPRSGEFAIQAARLGEVDQVANAIEKLVASGRFDEAAKLLDTAPLPTEAWTARGIVRAALALPDPQAALRIARRYEATRIELSPYIVAKALLRAGRVQEAHRRLTGTAPKVAEDRDTVFEVALAAGDSTSALAQIDVLKPDRFAENLQRAALLAHAVPSSLFAPKMIGIAFLFAAMLAMMCACAGMLLVPAHYRGLARRLRKQRTSSPFEGITLVHAWYGLCVAICVPTIAIAVVSPGSLAVVLGDGGAKQASLFGGMLWGTIAGLLCFLPVFLPLPRRQLVGDRLTWRNGWWRVPMAWAGLWVVGIVLALFHGATGGGAATEHTKMVETLVGEGNAAFGGFGSLLVIAVLAPIFEELTFRGLLLGGLSRHISFGWANTFQALAFALIHDDPPRFLFYFAMGLFGGWLVKSTKSLGPAIAMHAINNGFVVLLHMA